MKTINVSNGDIIEFIAITWDERWEFDQPTVLLEPVLKYNDSCNTCWYIIESAAIDLSCDGILSDDNSYVLEEFDWRGWKINRLRQVMRDRMRGKDTWKTKSCSVMKQVIRFYEEDGEMMFDIIEMKEY